MYTVISGRSAEFNLTRISTPLPRRLMQPGIPLQSDVINLLSLQVTADFARR